MHINDWASNAGAQYGALAHSLLNGRLDLEKDPPAAMAELENPYDTAARQAAAPDALWDVAYYNGRYYVYFGIVPCLLFQLPFEALTGIRDLPPALPMILLAWLYILAVFGFVKQAARHWFPQASAAAYLLTAAGAASGTQICYLLHRPSVYEYAILCGATFVLWALWQWLCAANTPESADFPPRVRLSLHGVGRGLPPPDGAFCRAGPAHPLAALYHGKAPVHPPGRRGSRCIYPARCACGRRPYVVQRRAVRLAV